MNAVDVMLAALEVEAWGIDGRAVDLGVAGRAWLGVPRGGAADPTALRLANRLVGNADGATGLETAGGLVVRTRRAVVVAVTGAHADVDVADGPAVGWGTPVALPPGAVLRVRRLVDGVRAYVAVRGGVAGVDGGRVLLGPEPAEAPSRAAAVPRIRPEHVRAWRGPRLDRVEDGAFERLLASPMHVVSTSRVGCRLGGVVLRHRDASDHDSEGLLEGAVQVPPDGSPIVMLADHPTTGGYPVVAVVDPDDVWVVAQASVGSLLRFREAGRKDRA